MATLIINTLIFSWVVIFWLLDYTCISLNKQTWQLRIFKWLMITFWKCSNWYSHAFSPFKDRWSARKNPYKHWYYTIQRYFLSDFNGSNDKQPDFKTIGPFQCYADKDSPTGRFHSWDGRTTWCPHKGEREGRNHSISYLGHLVLHIIWACLDC